MDRLELLFFHILEQVSRHRLNLRPGSEAQCVEVHQFPEEPEADADVLFEFVAGRALPCEKALHVTDELRLFMSDHCAEKAHLLELSFLIDPHVVDVMKLRIQSRCFGMHLKKDCQ